MEKEEKRQKLGESIAFQESYNDRFGCCICLGPKLRMVTGHCQHRICEECLYVGSDRRQCMQNCPVCHYNESFPRYRPVIPTSTIEMQVCLGVQKCPRSGCSVQLWFWEVDEHLEECDAESNHTPNKRIKISRKGRETPQTSRPLRSNVSPRRSRHQSETSNQENTVPSVSVTRSQSVNNNSRNQRLLDSSKYQSTTMSESADPASSTRNQQTSGSHSQRSPSFGGFVSSSRENKHPKQSRSQSRSRDNTLTESSVVSQDTNQRVDELSGSRNLRRHKNRNIRLDTLRSRSRR